MGMHQMLGPSFGSAADYEIQRSLRFNSGDSAYLSRTPSSAGNRKKWTWSGWVKRSELGRVQNIFRVVGALSDTTVFQIRFMSNDAIGVVNYSYYPLISNAVFRDVGAWLHLVVSLDVDQGSNSNKLRFYINGSEVTSWATDNRGSLGTNAQGVNQASVAHMIGGQGSSEYFSGYLAEIHFVDGQQLAPTAFGEYNDDNVWQPKRFSGTYGTNGFHLDFSDNSSSSALGTDSSGNSNTWTVNNLSVASGSGNDSLIDTPTNYEASSGNNGGNYCTLSPLKNAQTLSNGNLDVVGGSSWQRSVGTLGMYSGKYYWEYTITASNEHLIGVGPPDMQLSGNLGAGSPPGSGYGTELGFVNGTGANGSWSNTGGSGAGDVIGIAFDADNGKMYVYKNGTALNSGAASHTGLVMPQIPVVSLNGSSRSGVINFGARPFQYTPPTGYVSLCTTNLAEPPIADGSAYFDTKLYTGNGSTQSVSLNFGPDLLWLKSRSSTKLHALCDSVRGDGKLIYSSSTLAEQDIGASVVDLTSSGFNLGFNSSFTQVSHNHNGESLVGWAWNAGTSTVSNTDGSITSSVRVNQSAGFSIATYTGNGTTNSTVGHGLNAAPSLVIIKNRSNAYSWAVLHTSAGTTGTTLDGSAEYYMLQLDSDAARNNFTNDNIWNPTNTTFKINGSGTANWVNANGDYYVAYSWAPVEGFSAFGSYAGNSSADGPFVFTGFRPKFLIVKIYDQADHWIMWDSVRGDKNVNNLPLYPNLTNSESANISRQVDLLSNGFKLRATDNSINGSHNYVYIAFAEHPLKTARAR